MGIHGGSGMSSKKMTVGAMGLIVLCLHAACVPVAGMRGGRNADDSESRYSGSLVRVDAQVLIPSVPTRLVSIPSAEFQRALRRLSGHLRVEGTAQEAAQRLFQTLPEEDLLAEVYGGRVYSLVPLDEKAPLAPQAESALRADYLHWCEGRGGGDCLGLLTDGPYLRTDDRRTLALALAFGAVLGETQQALGRELSPRAVVSSLVWMVGLYLTLWLVPEPCTKAVAAALSVCLVAWLGLDVMWGLMDGWARMASRAHEATTFTELHAAAGEFAKVLGTDAARALVLSVATLSGRALGDFSTWIRSLPNYELAQAQWTVQGASGSLSQTVAQVVEVEAVESAEATSGRVLVVLSSPQGVLAGAMLSQNSAAVTPQRHSATIAIRHRGGNQQVILSNGQRWHLPRGKWLEDIPMEDTLGDELQAAVERLAREWSPRELSSAEAEVIENAIKQGNDRSAAHLQGLARGRWVHRKMQRLFTQLVWNVKGVDVVDPVSGIKYEILSGTAENFGVHGRRMATELYRMIFF